MRRLLVNLQGFYGDSTRNWMSRICKAMRERTFNKRIMTLVNIIAIGIRYHNSQDRKSFTKLIAL
jgi:hypothetical protein